ncbi:MAG: ATP-grasp domain-containing protein [Ignavibacteriales bacterium]|nr:MAG: ATP-grasp domain-containing protein [Ignavibacteriales bacterium]
MRTKTKVAIVYNEAHPDFYAKSVDHEVKELDFIPYFEVDELTPIEEFEIIAESLRKLGLDAYTLNISDNLNLLLREIKKNQPDVLFNFIELYKDNARLEMNIVGLLELIGIPFTGAPSDALANCQNKVLAKRILKASGIKTPEFMLVNKPVKRLNHKLKFPIIVKPAYEDASVGIENESIVSNDRQLSRRIEYVHHHFLQPSLIEEFIDGRELNVAVLGDKNPVTLPISEISFEKMPGHLFNIVSYQAKWDPLHESYHKTIPICPAKLPKRIEAKAKDNALKAFKIMGCRDYARIDMRLSHKGELYVLEVNPNPDLTEGAGFMRSAEAAGFTYGTALQRIVELALERNKRNNGNGFFEGTLGLMTGK